MSEQRPFAGKGPKGYMRSDERIREEICELISDGHIDASEIEVQVRDGEVTLTGMVSERRVKRMAEEAVEGARGVKDVNNQIKVQNGDSRSAAKTESGMMKSETGSTSSASRDSTSSSASKRASA